MIDTIVVGKAGRLVIPKILRERLGIRTGARLRVQVAGGILQLEPLPDEVRISDKDGFPVITSTAMREQARTVEAIKADRAERDRRIAGQAPGE